MLVTSAIMTLCIVLLLIAGIVLMTQPKRLKGQVPWWLKGGIVANVAVFFSSLLVLMLLGVDSAVAATEVVQNADGISIGKGLALIGAGLPTAIAALAAGRAVGAVGSASLAVIVEKPEAFGRTLVYLGLAEGIAIYGLVISILLIGKI